jgi:hypothetical protein
MHKHIVILIVAAAAVIHAQAADLVSQLTGYWQPDMEKTLALPKNASREMDPMSQALMAKMVFEFQKDKMIVHNPPGMESNTPPLPYTVKAVDQAANSLTLSADKKDMKIRFDKGQMALNDQEKGWMIFNRMSKEDFAKRQAGGVAIEAEGGDKAPAEGKVADASSQPIPDKPAAGKIGGKVFKVVAATLDSRESTLELQQDADTMFKIVLLEKNADKFDGKKYTVPSKQPADAPRIHLGYKIEGGLNKGEVFMSKYSMKLEFGTPKDGKIPGKIHLRLPDDAGSFVVGTFEAEIK